VSTETVKGESEDAEAHLSPQDKFHTGIFLAIINSMTGAFKKRLDAYSLYSLVRNLYGVSHEILDLTQESIRESSN